MINITENIISKINGIKLHNEINKAISRAIDLIEIHQGQKTNIRSMPFAFSRLLGTHNHPENIKFDEKFLNALLAYSQSNSQNTGTAASLNILKQYVIYYNLPATYMHRLKHGVRLMLLTLWDRGIILLPSTFTTGPHFSIEIFENILLKWVLTFDPKNSVNIRIPTGNISDHRRIYYYGPRLLFSSDWKTVEDVSLADIALLHRAQRLYQENYTSNVIAGNQIPYTAFTTYLLKSFPDKVKYNNNDLKAYSQWSLSHEISNQIFTDYVASKNTNQNTFPKIPKIRSGTRIKISQSDPISEPILINSKIDAYKTLIDRFVIIGQNKADSTNWRIGIPSYPGREHVDLSDIAPIWIDALNAYMFHRTNVQEYRSEKTPISALNILVDYIFFYLPWWKELSPSSNIQVPISPRYFTRYNFVIRHTSDSPEKIPSTLFELIQARRMAKSSASCAKRQICLFFEYIEINFSDNEFIAGQNFSNPINIKLDIPKSEKPGKTNKVVFPKNIYGYLLFWLYAIEEFGLHLEKLALSGRLPIPRGQLRTTRRFMCEEFNFIPKYKYRGQELELKSVPNIFTWADREIYDGENTRVAYLPHCTTLRLLITSYETGLRCQSVQWLDRNSWNSHSKDYQDDSYTFPIYVNTDKTKLEAWTTLIVFRVRDILQREQDFQERCVDTASIPSIHYENNSNSPFGFISPLFRGVNTPNPVTDQRYSDDWKLLMIEFEFFFRIKFKDSRLKMFTLNPLMDANNVSPVIRYEGNTEQRPYCPISILAINTPHSCRSSFITNRKGLMELSDLADQVGHADIITTSHYDRPSGDDLHERLTNADMQLFSEWKQFDPTSGVHIRADQPDSSLVKNFIKDRIGTVAKYKFMPSIAMWALEDVKRNDEGLTILKEGPMSHIRFRETHICPVGEECPSDILERIGEPRRCGCCPLAMKCIDHLTAISAKRNQLVERIKFRQKQRVQMEKSGEPTSTLDEIWEAMDLDINEMLGWKLSEDILISLKDRNINSDISNFMHVESPEIVKNHIVRVSKTSNETEFLLQRIADSNAYPSYSTPQVQANAARIKRKLLSGKSEDSIEEWTDDFSDVQGVAKMLGLMMKARQLNISDIAVHIATPPPSTFARQLPK